MVTLFLCDDNVISLRIPFMISHLAVVNNNYITYLPTDSYRIRHQNNKFQKRLGLNPRKYAIDVISANVDLDRLSAKADPTL